MKYLFSLAIVGSFFFGSCKPIGAQSDNPKATAQAFVEAMSKADFDAAEKCASKESQNVFEKFKMMQGIAKMAGKSDELSSAFKVFQGKNISFGEAKINDENATVEVKSEGQNEGFPLPLIKEGGSWKVDFTVTGAINSSDEKVNVPNSPVDINTIQQGINKMGDTTSAEFQKAAKILDSLKIQH